jgi:hypothetical protein
MIVGLKTGLNIRTTEKKIPLYPPFAKGGVYVHLENPEISDTLGEWV